MSMTVDDRDASINYHGRWSFPSGDDKAYGRTVSATDNSGATATFKFRGTKVKLYLVVPSGNSGSIKIRAILDDRSPFELERNVQSSTVYHDVWYEAGDLSNTQHTLIIQNISREGGNAMQVDRFDIDGSPVSPQPPPPPPPPSTPSTITRVSSQIVTSIVFQTSTVTSSLSASLSDSSSSTATPGSSSPQSPTSTSSGRVPTSTSPQQSSGDRTVTAIQILTTAPNGSVQTILTTSDQQASVGNSSNEVPVGGLIGGVLGAIILLSTAVILAFLLIRRRRKRTVVGDDSDRLTHERGPINPFLAQDQGDVFTNNISTVLRTTTASSPSRSVHGDFYPDEKHTGPSGYTGSTHDALTSAGQGTDGSYPHRRPHDLSGDTHTPDSPSQAESLGATPRHHLRLHHSHDTPPSYQSVGNRPSNVQVQHTTTNTSHVSYVSPRYSEFGLGRPPMEPPNH